VLEEAPAPPAPAPAPEPVPLRQLSHCGVGAPPLATCCDSEGHTDCEQHHATAG